jgi:hypothetical protein
MPPIHPLAIPQNPAADAQDSVEKKVVYCPFVLTWPIILTLRVSSLKMKGSQAGTDSHYTKSICQVSDFVKSFGKKKSPRLTTAVGIIMGIKIKILGSHR